MEKIVDEMCACGHKKSEHDNSMPGVKVTEGHGACGVSDCDCGKFTWVEFIFEEDV